MLRRSIASYLKWESICAVVGNLPCVPPEKKEKLEAIVLKIYSQIGAIKKGAS